MTVARLENENEELKHVIEILKKKIEPQFQDQPQIESEVRFFKSLILYKIKNVWMVVESLKN